MKIDKPIFIIGSGRSGTTVFYNHLALHPEICWFSNYSNRFLNIKFIPLMHRLLDLPFAGTRLKKEIISKRKFFIKPSEAGHIYHDYCGFRHSVKTTESDFDFSTENLFKDVIRRHLVLSGKKRFLSKQTANTQRIRLINKIFNDAYYIHIIRDGRAVANSLVNVDWGKETVIWWTGEKACEWERKGGEIIELCGLRWANNVREILDNKYLFENRYIEVKYEDFVLDVKGIMSKIADFCELGKSKHFFDLLPETLPDMNIKWKEGLTETQKAILENILRPFLDQLGYK